MQYDDLDTSQTTGTGTADASDADATPPSWQFRVVYASFTGVVGADAKAWSGEHPLGLGRRTTSPHAASPWLHIADERASREHARVFLADNRPFVEDLHSKHGTFLNGERLHPSKLHELRDGDLLRVGDSFVFVRYEQEVEDVPIPAVVGVSRAARLIRRSIARCARTTRSILLLGETGTGKEVVAQSIHTLSQRRGKLVAVNCAAVPPTLAEAQFFGTHKGAFTGATELAGCFVEAQAGTLFLDEVGDLPLDLQPKLLRALETREVTPLGSQRPVPIELRMLSATHRDLERAIQEQTFRQDLYARLAAETVHLCPLRERREDILLLAQHFAGSSWKPSPRLVAALLRYAWPLNVREVGNVIGRLDQDNEPEVIARLLAPPADSVRLAPAVTAPAPSVLPALTNFEEAVKKPWNTGDPVPTREQVVALLNQHRGNLHAIEREFGASRRQFRRWAEVKYGLDIESYRSQ